ncbi:MAG: class I SAM-dependent methyltransferase [Candidatus Firestonebacteria bacterium]
MKFYKQAHTCPVGIAGFLDNKIRRFFQNPQKILKSYVKSGMTVLDVGCGPGFFSIEMARMVGPSGQVIAVDLQEGMLQKLRNKIKGTEDEKRIKLHKCEENKIGIYEKVDLILAFYMIHEISNQDIFFREIHSMLNPDGRFFIVEPKFHVSKKAFEETINIATKIGFEIIEKPRVFFSRSIVLTNNRFYGDRHHINIDMRDE